MHHANLKTWALIQEQLVRVEGMKAMNHERQSNGMALAYDESSFWEASQEIARLAESFDGNS